MTKNSLFANKLFVRSWPFVLLASIPLAYCLLVVLKSPGDWNIIFQSEFWDNLYKGAAYLLSLCIPPIWTTVEMVGVRTFEEMHKVNRGFVYAAFALAALALSLFRWFKAPRVRTLLWTMFCAWVLCGIPGHLFLFLVSGNFRMPGDGPLMPRRHDTILLLDGTLGKRLSGDKLVRYLPDGSREASLPDGTRELFLPDDNHLLILSTGTPDSPSLWLLPEGCGIRLLPDGGREISLPDGSRMHAFPGSGYKWITHSSRERDSRTECYAPNGGYGWIFSDGKAKPGPWSECPKAD